jgi:hypothetical protein
MLEADAETRRSRFENTIKRLEEKTKPRSLNNTAIANVGAPTSREVAEALRRNPMLAAVLALCVGAIAVEVIRVRKQRTILVGRRASVAPDRNRLTPAS